MAPLLIPKIDDEFVQQVAHDVDALRAIASDKTIRTWYEWGVGSPNCYGRALAQANSPCSQMDEKTRNNVIFGFMGCMLDEMHQPKAKCWSMEECFAGFPHDAPVTVVLHMRTFAYQAVLGNFTSLCLFNEFAASNRGMDNVTKQLQSFFDEQRGELNDALKREQSINAKLFDLKTNYSSLERKHYQLSRNHTDLQHLYEEAVNKSNRCINVHTLANHVRKLADKLLVADMSGALSRIMPTVIADMMPKGTLTWIMIQVTHFNSSDEYVLAIFGVVVGVATVLLRQVLVRARARRS